MPGFSLVDERWVPVRRRSGRADWIAPSQITEALADDPIVALAAPRADFTGALIEFLIGLVTTCTAPADEDAWEDWWLAPPGPNTLRNAFAPHAHAFLLDGDGPRFLQDLEELDAEPKNVSALLIDAPGEQTLERNADLFNKRGRVNALCPAAAAMALTALQTYSPSGGKGHLTSLRGGGPLTTLVAAGNTLWHRVWANVESKRQIEDRGAAFFDAGGTDDPECIFPWLCKTRTSGKDGRETTPREVNPLQVYWGMPRRVRLDFSPAQGARCDLTGLAASHLVQSYRTRPYGTKYSVGFDHPLSPYYRDKKSLAYLPRHVQPGGVSYRHWLGLVVEDEDRGRPPAQCVRHFRTARASILGNEAPRLGAFGYDMDNMKARAWAESEMPLITAPRSADRQNLDDMARHMVRSAEAVARALVETVKKALFDDPKKASGDFSFVGERFWHDTEAAFHGHLHDVPVATTGDVDDEVMLAIRRRWLGAMRQAALAIFDAEVATLGLEEGSMARIVGARFDLNRRLAGFGKGKMIFEYLALPQKRNTKARSMESAQ